MDRAAPTARLMDRLLDPPAWLALAAAVSAALLATAHVFQALGYPPCALCLTQREVYWTAIGLAAAALGGWALTGRRAVVARAGAVALAVVFLVGAGVALYHAGAEWKFWPGPAVCAAAAAAGVEGDLLASLSRPMQVVRCDEASWVFLGLSMAAWNMLVSLCLAALSAVVALRRIPLPRQDEVIA